MTTQVEFSDQNKADLNYERYNHPHPFVQQKMEALWLKSQGLAHGEICRLVAICSTTLTSYLLDYREGGVEGLKTLSFRRPRSVLEDHRDTLEAYFREHPPANATEAMAVIERLTGIKRSPERVRVFMKKMGMKCRKVGMIPAKADIEAQEDFKKKSLSPGWKKPKGAAARSSSSMPRISF
jgi:transposase